LTTEQPPREMPAAQEVPRLRAGVVSQAWRRSFR
jgi:hypothetical protein